MAMDGAITSWAWTGGSPSSMIQQAKEELEVLEAQYPNRFDYLKDELKSFINLIEPQNTTKFNNMVLCVNPTSSSTTTQASSTQKKRKQGCPGFQKVKRVVSNVEAIGNKYEKVECEGEVITKRKRIDAVMEKAQACLHKIQLLKTSFYLDDLF